MSLSSARRAFAAGTPDETDAAYELLPRDEAAPDDCDEPGAAHPLDLPGPRPTARQALVLPRVAGAVPWTAYAIALVEFAERASYYGVKGVFTNFIQRPLPPGSTTGVPTTAQGSPGALGLGLGWSTALGTVFTMMAYTTPLVGGVLADARWGKFRTVATGTALAGAAHVLFVYAALPALLQAGKAFAPFLASLVLLGASAGLIKANIAPLMAEQYRADDYVTLSPAGDKVIVDREATVQKIMSAYYHAINLGAFAAIASTFAEKYVGFWLAFLIPGAIFFVMPPVLCLVHPHLVPSQPPSTSALLEAIASLRPSQAIKLNRADGDDVDDVSAAELEHADGGVTAARAQVHSPARTAADVRAVCGLFAFFAIYNIADSGLDALMTSLAGSMTTNGVPNDVLEKANPFAIVVSIPLLDRFVYPALAARGIAFGPVRRIVVGFVLAAAGMAWLAALQHAVYATSPCGYAATTCDAGVSPLSAWLVLPAPLLTGISESLAVVSATELAYTMSPPNLASVVNALFLATQAVSAALVLAAVPALHDPRLVWPFAAAALATAAAAGGVWRLYGHLDQPGRRRAHA